MLSRPDQVTPTAGDAGSMPEDRRPPSPARLRLNPEFVETLMGLAVGWTALERIGSDASETPSSRSKRRSRGES
jgi:hypothetical protein